MKTAPLPKSQLALNGPQAEFAPEVLLVPVDFSALSESALERAKQIAQQFGSKLYLIHAVEPVIHPVEYAIVPREMEDINTQLVAERKTRLEAIHEKLAEEGVASKAEVKLGKPWQVIVEQAKKTQADLIVIPTHGLTGPKHLLLGSTAERVVQHAPCSVLVVR